MMQVPVLYSNCTLVDEHGRPRADRVTIALRIREKSHKQPDVAPLWFGALSFAAPLTVESCEVLTLHIPGEFAGVIQICGWAPAADGSVRFIGLSESPHEALGQYREPATKTCDECQSPFFPSASCMDGLCPECAHALYGYDNCEHTFSQGACTKCGWDGSRSDFLKQAD